MEINYRLTFARCLRAICKELSIHIIMHLSRGGSRYLMHVGLKFKLLTLALAIDESKANFKSL